MKIHIFPVVLIKIKLEEPLHLRVSVVYADRLISAVLGKVCKGSGRAKEGWEQEEVLNWWQCSCLFLF